MKLHEDVLKILLLYRSNHPDFNFIPRKINRNNKLNKGYYFQGNDSYVFAGIIDKSGGSYMTRSCGILFDKTNEGFDCKFVVQYKDEKDPLLLSFYDALKSLVPGGKRNEYNDQYIYDIGSITISNRQSLFEFLDIYFPKIKKLCENSNINGLLLKNEKYDSLIQNIINTENTPNYWVFQGNPKIYDITNALKAAHLKSWKVAAHKDKIKKGDKVIIWQTGDESGCYALAEVISEVGEIEEQDYEKYYYKVDNVENDALRVKLKVTDYAADNPILWKTIKELEQFNKFKAGNQGTNFSATKIEFEKMKQLILNNSKSIRERFSLWLNEKETSKKAKSYIRAIDILNEVLNKDLYKESNIIVLNALYEDLLENQTDVNGKFAYKKAPSYGKDRFYSAAIKSFIKFLREVVSVEGEEEFIEVLKILGRKDVEAYFNFLDTIKTKLSLEIDNNNNNNRLVTSISRQRLNFIVGQRYCWNLYSKNRKGKFGVISAAKINATTEDFEGGKNDAFYTYAADHKLAFDNKASIIKAISNEIERTTKSSFDKYNNTAFEKAMFDIQYRTEVFEKVYSEAIDSVSISYSYRQYLEKQDNLKQSRRENYLENLTKKLDKYWGKYFDSDYDDSDFSFEALTRLLTFSKKNYGTSFKGKLYFQDFIKELLNDTKQNKTMNSPINQILYGPPGTGKTYKLQNEYFSKYTISESSLTKEQFLNNIVSDLTWWQVLAIALYDLKKADASNIVDHYIVKTKSNLANSKNPRTTIWGRLQAHTIDDCEYVKVSDRSEPRLFKKNRDSSWEIIQENIDNFYPEAISLLEETNSFQPSANKQIKNYEFVTFHQSFSYEDFVEGIKPIMEDGETDLGYKIEDGVFKKLCNRAKADPENNYAIFIDEINRGNVSAIFGELITLIEKDKRAGATNALEVQLPYSKDKFSVPINLHIYGTMNTADRSVEALDSALRRRFTFKELMPNESLLYDKQFEDFTLEEVLKTINDRIEILVDRDHTIGHSYFMAVESGDTESLSIVFKDKIIPLLQEYFYHDYEKIALILGSGFVEENTNNEVKFAHFKNIELPSFETQYILKSEVLDIETAIHLLLNNN
ncbi:5-Methylcytosine-specific restriction enzyme B [unidentified eubacterium SCB49]|nr:5-Methylcytosine-specific restriction enzyme B [unidentified eubacterium SCB49]